MQQTIVGGVVGGLVGVIAGAYLESQVRHFTNVPLASASSHERSGNVVSASRIELLDGGGKVRAELAMSVDGGPALFFLDSAGRNRLAVGLYSPAEGEAPSVVLNDPQQRAVGIFRLFGDHDTPVLVLKNQGRDRSVYGLNPSSAEPFLANYDEGGIKSSVFGHY